MKHCTEFYALFQSSLDVLDVFWCTDGAFSRDFHYRIKPFSSNFFIHILWPELMVQYYCILFVNAYKITIEWKQFLWAYILYQSTLVVAGNKKSGSDSCTFLCCTPCINIVILATKADGVIITGSGNQSPGPGQSAPNSVVSGNGTTLVLNSAATSPATSPTITSHQATIGGVNGSLSSAPCPPHVTSTVVTLPPPPAPPPNPRPPPPLPPRRPREHPLMDSNPPQQVTYMLVSDRKSYLIQSLGFCRTLSDHCNTLLSVFELQNL